MPYARPQTLERAHEREGFECGEAELDRWLAEYALEAQGAGSARVFVSVAEGRVAGYYALAAAEVRPEEATARALKGQPRRRAVPAVLLARLAVAERHQGRGLGRSLLQDAMLRVAATAEQIGVRVMLVHAKDGRAREWYERFGFEESPAEPLQLMLLMKDLRAFLASVSS
jgi:GNAT superfamily N-acetyltransferase